MDSSVSSLSENLEATHLSKSGDSEPAHQVKSASKRHSNRGCIPVIDMAGLEGAARDSTIAEIGRACADWGFFQVINHGIPEWILERVKKTSREFYDLPVEERLMYAVKPGSRAGYYSKKIDIQDGVGADALCEKHVDHFYHFFNPLALKDMDMWPRHPTQYREVMDEYSKDLKKLSLSLLAICALSLGLKESFFDDVFGEATHSIRLNYYPPIPSLESRITGLGEHSDPGGITVLLQGDTVGLQVRAKDGEWVDVQPLQNAFVVNMGDQIEILSNGKYKSVEHRGLLGAKEERLSLAAFYSPSMQSVIAPASELIEDSHPALYSSTTYADYLESFFERGLEGKSHVNRKYARHQ